jgi:hypothetical protein
MSEPPFDLAKAHRWFAVEFNNVAWELCELPARTAEETERMIDAAHASLQHWRHAGTVLNELRGQVLLATCYVAAGQVEGALRHGYRACELIPAAAEAPPFDLVGAWGSAAGAAALAGKNDDAQRMRSEALAALARLDDEDDRRVATQLWKLAPDA